MAGVFELQNVTLRVWQKNEAAMPSCSVAPLPAGT